MYLSSIGQAELKDGRIRFKEGQLIQIKQFPLLKFNKALN